MADRVQHVGISGSGTIHGSGGSGEDFRAYPLNDDGSAWHKPKRPSIILCYYCQYVHVHDVTLESPHNWTQHYLACDFLTLRGLRVHAHGNANGDGLDIDGCQDVLIRECMIDVDDDALVFKGRAARDNRNITVQGCIFASKITAIKMGTESTGGFQNVSITNCIIRPSYEVKHVDPHRQQMSGSGIALETTDGGHIDGVVLANIVMEGCYAPFFIKRGNRGRKYGGEQKCFESGGLRNVLIQNIICRRMSAHYTSTLTGFPGGPLQNITIENVILEHPGGVSATQIQDTMPERSRDFPWPGMFAHSDDKGGNMAYPAYGFYLRHVENIRIRHITAQVAVPDVRPAIYAESVQKASFHDIDVGPAGVAVATLDCAARGSLITSTP